MKPIGYLLFGNFKLLEIEFELILVNHILFSVMYMHEYDLLRRILVTCSTGMPMMFSSLGNCHIHFSHSP